MKNLTITVLVVLNLLTGFTSALEGVGGEPQAQGTPEPDTDISSCTQITESGDYVLEYSVLGTNTAGACIIISASNVKLDCQGNQIYDTPNGAGIKVTGNNNVVTRCLSRRNEVGFENQGDNNIFQGNTANNNGRGYKDYGDGFSIYGHNNMFRGNIADENNGNGFTINTGNNTYTDNTANNNGKKNEYGNGFSIDIRDNRNGNNTFRGNIANENYDDGFEVINVGTMGSNTFTSNTANNNRNGFYVRSGSNTLSNNVIKSNKKIGVAIKSNANYLKGNEISGNGGDKVVGEGNIIIAAEAIFRNNKVSDGCGLRLEKPTEITLIENDFCDIGGTRTCADGYKISCFDGGQVLDGIGRNVFSEGDGAPSCRGLRRSPKTCDGSQNNRNPARAPGDVQQPNYNDAWLPVFALLGVLALGGFMWWHSKKK